MPPQALRKSPSSSSFRAGVAGEWSLAIRSIVPPCTGRQLCSVPNCRCYGTSANMACNDAGPESMHAAHDDMNLGLGFSVAGWQQHLQCHI
jgi:hypothetical protein